MSEPATLKLEIVSLTGPIWSGEVREVGLPGTDGGFGVLPRHAPLLSVLTLSRDPAGRAVELAQSSSRADRFQYQVAT